MKTNHKMHVPTKVCELLTQINEAGFQSYVVGGAVRDSLLDKEPKDWDICTDASPDDIKEIFGKTLDTGIKHGTVTVMRDDIGYEITTFRTEGEYSDNRRPDSIKFVKSLKEDLSRRDFTINAMACDQDGFIYDYFNGIRDLKHEVIKCVGDPEKRFSEDALRILRAVRFAAQLNFSIEHSTHRAILDLQKNLEFVSKERIRVEWDKILSSDRPGAWVYWFVENGLIDYIDPEIAKMYCFRQYNPYHKYDVLRHACHAIDCVGDDLILRIAMLYHDTGKPYTFELVDGRGRFHGHNKISSELAEKGLERLKYDRKTIDLVSKLVYYHDYRIDDKLRKVHIKRFLNKIGAENFDYWYQIRVSDVLSQNLKYAQKRLEKLFKIKNIVSEIIINEEAFSVKQLDFNGKDIMDILDIESSPQVGEILDLILDVVMSGGIKNNKKDIEDYLKELLDI